jgi:hypothetical protein
MIMPQHPNPTKIRVVVGWPEDVNSKLANGQR